MSVFINFAKTKSNKFNLHHNFFQVDPLKLSFRAIERIAKGYQ